MPPWMIGCFIPKSSVIRVLIDTGFSLRSLSGDLQITTEVMVGSAEQIVDCSQSLEVKANRLRRSRDFV